MRVSRSVVIVVAGLLVMALIWYLRSTYWYPITNKVGSGSGIVALGDSLTYGTGAGRGEDWPTLVSKRCSCTVVNKGVPGETTEDALARLEKDVLALNPRIVVIGLGGNDILQQLPRETMFSNLRTIIDRTQESGAMVVLLGLNGFPLGGSLKSGYTELARDTGSVYVSDILGGILTNAKLKSDQIHPNAAGYQVMADRIYEELEPHL